MLIGKENVRSWIEFNKTPFWRIKSGSGDNAGIIFTCQRGEENVALDDGVTRLNTALENLGPGNYCIEAWHTLDQKKGWNKTAFQLTVAHSGAPTHNQQHFVQGMGGMDIQAQITAAIEQERKNNKIERLEKELEAEKAKVRELQSQLDSTESKLGKRIEQILGPLMDMGSVTTKQPVQVGDPNDAAERVGNTMEKWATKDEEWESVLNGIVKLAYNDPTKYAMGKKMLTA